MHGDNMLMFITIIHLAGGTGMKIWKLEMSSKRNYGNDVKKSSILKME